MKRAGILALCVLCLPAQTLAGPNAGGVLLLHCSVDIQYTTSVASYCGLGSPDSCQEVNPSIELAPGRTVIAAVLAAFPDTSGPRVKAIDFGIQYDSLAVVIVDAGTCSDFEIAVAPWSRSPAGAALSWQAPQTSRIQQVYWFACELAKGASQGVLSLAACPGQAGIFVDDSMPPNEDPVTAFGALGFNCAGFAPECAGALYGGRQIYNADGQPVEPLPAGDPVSWSDRLVIGPHSKLEVVMDGQTRTFYAGETVAVEFREGVCFVGGHRYAPSGSPPSLPLSQLQATFGDVPFVREFVESRHGDEQEVWTEAVETHGLLLEDLLTNASVYFIRLRAAGGTRSDCARAVRDAMSHSALLDTVWISEREDFDDIPAAVWFRVAGMRPRQCFELLDEMDPRTTRPEFTEARARDLLLRLKSLESMTRAVQVVLDNGSCKMTVEQPITKRGKHRTPSMGH